ncbi:DUF6134 family protein [Telmatospirillum sp.]|uniref:DUF6134 family protein n=1 Tax=Telmatospirillum sp. TaxID=2079197 RepID=UPI002851832B|nr:DUF6134 family protein [Telmatospirillum sp.]MDR3436132.1 DUF6134 family protein [Telmatospirillum sp.]
MSLLSRHFLVAVAGLASGLSSGPAAAEPISYVILKEGQPIGHETVTIDRQGDLTTVQVQTETRVKVLFLDFHYHHQRVETWRAGRLESMVADTDDDGAIHHIEVSHPGQSVRLTVDGTTRETAGDALPLTLWGKAIIDHGNLYSIVDAEPYRVTIAALGKSTLALGGREMAAEHYRMTGDVDRDLWFGSDGLLLKVAFERRGYPIEIVRE